MAEKRMFTQKIIDSDAFLDMPLSAQALYFHLNMRADDDGFINNPKNLRRMVGASEDDLKILLAKRFVIDFESGVIVIKHWRMHNTLKSDRYKPTQYQKEYALLAINPNKSYTERTMVPNWNQTGTNLEPQISIEEKSIGLEECSFRREEIISGGGDILSLYNACARDVQDFFSRFFGRAATDYELEQIQEAIHNSHHTIGEALPEEFTYGDNDRELLQIAVESAAKANKTNVAYIVGCFRNFWQRGIRDGAANEDYEMGVRA